MDRGQGVLQRPRARRTRLGTTADLLACDRSTRGTPHDDAGLAHLNTSWGLASLPLSGCPVGDDGLFHLGGLYALRSLDLSRTRVRGPGLAALVDLPDLARLDLRDSALNVTAFAPLKAMRGLKELDIAEDPDFAPYADALRHARSDPDLGDPDSDHDEPD